MGVTTLAVLKQEKYQLIIRSYMYIHIFYKVTYILYLYKNLYVFYMYILYIHNIYIFKNR